jgi:hypothetical protein
MRRAFRAEWRQIASRGRWAHAALIFGLVYLTLIATAFVVGVIWLIAHRPLT